MARRPRALRLIGIALIVAALFLGFYTTVAIVALQSGRTLRTEQLRQERAAELANQLSRAIEDIDKGNFSLAERRLEWILEQDSDYPEARTLLESTEAALIETNNPPTRVSGEATATPDATATAVGGSNHGEDEDAAGELRGVERLVEQEAWEEAITALISLQHDYPNFERQQTDELLYEAYVAQGVDLLYGDQVELGLYYLDQAQRLGDLPQDVRDQQQWAELYLAGMGYFGVSWDVSLFYFRDLCLAAPFFHDSCQKLYEALVAYGDQYAVQQDWCPAESLYNEAYRLDDPDSLLQKLRRAREGCDAATPTPAAPVTDTAPVTRTMPFGGPLAPGGAP